MPPRAETPWISPLKGPPSESMPVGDATIEGSVHSENTSAKVMEDMFNISIVDINPINPVRSMIGDITEMIGEMYTIRDQKDHYHLKIPLNEFHPIRKEDDISITVDTVKELKIRINKDVPG